MIEFICDWPADELAHRVAAILDGEPAHAWLISAGGWQVDQSNNWYLRVIPDETMTGDHKKFQLSHRGMDGGKLKSLAAVLEWLVYATILQVV